MAENFQATLDAYIAALRKGDVDAFGECLAADVSFFGSITGTRMQGLAAVKGTFQAGDAIIGYQYIKEVQVYGFGPEIALVVPVQRPQDVEPLGFLTLLRMDAAARVKDIRLLWDPRRAFMEAGPRELPPTRPELTAFYQSFNAKAVAGILAQLAPDVRYFGTIVGRASTGIEGVHGILTSAREAIGIDRLEPRQIFGHGDRVGVLTKFFGRSGVFTYGIFGFEFNSAGKITELSVLWNPRPFLQG